MDNREMSFQGTLWAAAWASAGIAVAMLAIGTLRLAGTYLSTTSTQTPSK